MNALQKANALQGLLTDELTDYLGGANNAAKIEAIIRKAGKLNPNKIPDICFHKALKRYGFKSLEELRDKLNAFNDNLKSAFAVCLAERIATNFFIEVKTVF